MGEQDVGKGLPIRVKRARLRCGKSSSSGFGFAAEKTVAAAVIAVYWC